MKLRAGKEGIRYKHCEKFYDAITTYGWDSFEPFIIVDNINTKKEAMEIESKYISEYDSINNGYNNINDNNGKTWSWDISEERKGEISENKSKRIICDGKIFTNIKELCETYQELSVGVVYRWLNHNDSINDKFDKKVYYLKELGLKYYEDYTEKKLIDTNLYNKNKLMELSIKREQINLTLKSKAVELMEIMNDISSTDIDINKILAKNNRTSINESKLYKELELYLKENFLIE